MEDEIRFQKARAGDHLCTAFQCPNCQSQNIRGKSLEPDDAQDDAFECCATRVQLDAFWSHSSRTVAAHVREVNFSIKYAQRLGITNPFPRLGPFPLGDDMGMLQAIMVIMRSMEPGTGRGGRIKWNTARKNRSTGTVLWNVSPDSGSDIVLSSSSRRGRYVATSNPSEGAFYQMFALGCCARSGDIVNQDRAYTIELLQKLLTMYESEYNELGETMPLNAVCSCMFLLVTCLGGMRGFEAVWTDLATLRYDLTYCESLEDYSAVAWPIVGRFKAHNGIAGCYMIPIAGTTDSGIPFSLSGLRDSPTLLVKAEELMAGLFSEKMGHEPRRAITGETSSPSLRKSKLPQILLTNKLIFGKSSESNGQVVDSLPPTLSRWEWIQF